MKLRLLILTSLLAFRVLFLPLWFYHYIEHIQNKEAAFERVRPHKRRSFFYDRDEEGATVYHLTHIFSVFSVFRTSLTPFDKIFKQREPLRETEWSPVFNPPSTQFLSCPLFLLHRVFLL